VTIVAAFTLTVAGLGMAHPSEVAVDAALVAMAWGIGGFIGERIQHPGHLLPACVVVAAVDLTSVVSRFGPTHAIAESERALSLAAISFPVPGTSLAAPALGVGDLIFMAIVFAACRVHHLSVVRATVLCLGATWLAGVGSALLETAVPALMPVGAAVVLGIPPLRRLRREDRRAAVVAMVIAVSIAGGTIVSHYLGSAAAPPSPV
jgi:hypothetical protein